MKVRTGFVSNSSSSSYLIYGAKFNIDTAVKKYSKTIKSEDVSEDSFFDAVYDLELAHQSLDDGSDGTVWIGASLLSDDESIKEDKFLKALEKAKVEVPKKLERLGLQAKKFEFYLDLYAGY